MMYYFSDSPVVLTDLPSDLNSSAVATDDGRFVAVLVRSRIYFHCQKSNVLLCLYRHSSIHIEKYGNLAYATWNSDGNTLLLRTDLGFLCLLYLSISEIEQINYDNSVKIRYEVSVKSVNILHSLGQFSCCISTCNKIIAGNRLGQVICLNWLGEVLPNEGFDFHSIPVQSEFGINAVTSRIESSVKCHRFYWAPTLGGFLAILTNGRLILVVFPLSRLDPEQVRAVYLTQVELYSPLSVNSRFRSFAVGSSNGQITSYHLDDMSTGLVISQEFRLPDSVRHGIDKLPGAVKTLSWSPDGYCLAAAWSTHGMALWSVFGSLLYSTFLDQTEVTRFLAPLNFCWTLKGFHLWTICSFVDDPDRREREEYLNAFRERLLHSCNAHPQTQRQIAKNVAKMRSDLRLDDSGSDASGSAVTTNGNSNLEKNRNFLMVFRLAKSALAANPTGDNHLHLLMYTADSIYVTVRRFLHSRRNILTVPLPPEYIRANFPLKFAAINPQGSQVVVAGSRGFALCVLSALQWRLFGNITQEQAFEVHAGLAWWGHFICLCTFNYTVNYCEIRCYPCTEKLDDRFASVLPLDGSIRPLVLDVVGNRLIVFSTDSQYRSFGLAFGSRPHEDESSQRRNATDPEDTTLLVTYAGNLLLLPNLDTTSLTEPYSENGSVIAGFFGFGYKKDMDTRKYRDTFSPTLIASRVELLWSPSVYVPSASPPQRPIGFADAGTSDSESEEDAEASEVSLNGPLSEEGERLVVNCPQTPSFLRNSIWFFCGADGVRIWLPLDTSVTKRSSMGEPSISPSPNMEKKLQSAGGAHFHPPVPSTKASRRVMISLGLDGLSFPLVIFLDKAVLVTVQSDYLRTERSYSDVLSDPFIQMPFYCVNYKTNLFLPHLLKDLLRKNLSEVAFELASAYRHLPYFQHILELLLHEVLEEEATSKLPIPDPLLPQVTAFIEQFPHFLDVVVQCTRKTEVTWWRHLFCSLGRRPKDIFDHALSLEQLDTATSCLVILQNSESQATCKQCALLLLETTIKECQWHHVRDLMRFLKATTLSDKSAGDMLNEVDAFFERVKCRFLREGSWKSLEEIFVNVPSIPSNGTVLQNDLIESSDLQISLLSHWILANREHVAIVDDWPRCFQLLHSDFGMFLPLATSKDGVSISRQRRPGFARALKGDKRDSLSNLEASPPISYSNFNDETPTFHEALRTQQQLQKLLGHLLLALRELESLSGPDVFGPPEIALFSWTLLVAVLQLDIQAVHTILSFLQKKCETNISPESSITSIFNGLESLESMMSANPRANPEYFGFFVELKPRIRKFVPPPMKSKPVPVKAVGKSASKIPNGVQVEQKSAPVSKAPPEDHISLSMSMQTMKTQNHISADFESTSDEHLVHPGLDEEGSRSSCIVS